MENEKILTFMSPADKTWLSGLAPENRLAGLAFIDYKKAMGLRATTISRPELFMNGFELGMAIAANQLAQKMITTIGDPEKAENLPGEHL